MDFEMRPITEDEFPAFLRAADRVFGEHASEDEIEHDRLAFDFEGSLAVFDGDRIVGTGALFPFELTVPGPRIVSAGGVTWITVQSDYRRRGILTTMMRRQMDDISRRGEKLAVLFASESAIYGRFGFGMATSQAHFEIGTQYRDLAHAPDIPGNVTLVEKDRAAELLPAIYERWRHCQPGAIDMKSSWWEHWLHDPKRWWEGSTPRYYAIYETGPGNPEGFAAYRLTAKWDGGFPTYTLRMVRFIAVSPAARAALWTFCLNVDLVQTVTLAGVPVDEPLRWMLADPRRLLMKGYTDGLWTRLIDITACMEARCYGIEGRLVFDVEDAFLPANSGRYLLEGSTYGARCVKTEDEADLALHINDLSSLYLGGAAPSVLAVAGRIRELRSGALRKADLMFRSEIAPYNPIDF